MKDDLALPPDINLAIKAHITVVDVLKEDDSCCTCGCRAFYSPAEWRERGESYGLNSLLIVVYDGGSLAPYFSLDQDAGSLYEKMSKALEKIGCYTEECTGWYSAIYPLKAIYQSKEKRQNG